MLATQNGLSEVVQELLNTEVNVNAKNNDKRIRDKKIPH